MHLILLFYLVKCILDESPALQQCSLSIPSMWIYVFYCATGRVCVRNKALIDLYTSLTQLILQQFMNMNVI